jgi:hypothetical protein
MNQTDKNQNFIETLIPHIRVTRYFYCFKLDLFFLIKRSEK